jgi:hypothetical protein
MEEKSVLLKVELDVSALKTSAKEAEERLAVLKPQMEALRKESGTGTVEYAKLKEEVKQYTKQLNDSASALQINEKLSKSNNKSNVELSQAQKALAVAFNQLTQDQRENTEEGRKITEQYKAVNDALNATSLSVSDGRRNVGLYAESIKKAYAELDVMKKQVNQIGYAMSSNQKELDKNKAALDKLAKSGDTTSAEYKNLADEVQFYTEAVQQNNATLNSANDELKQQEEQLAKTEKEARKIGFVYGEQEEQTKSLKTQLKELKAELATMDPNSEAFIEGAERAGELADKIKDANEAVKAQTSGSGFEKLGNTFGMLKDDLTNLDFQGVAEKAKSFNSIAQGMTLKEMTGGLKNAGSAILNLGKTLLTNPIFLLAAVIGGVVAALSYFSESTKTAVAENEALNASLERSRANLDRQSIKAKDEADIRLKMAEAEGASEEELLKLKLKVMEVDYFTKLDKAKLEFIAAKKLKVSLQNLREEENFEEAKKVQGEIKAANTKYMTLMQSASNYYKEVDIEKKKFNKQQSDKDKADAEAAKKKQDDANQKYREGRIEALKKIREAEDEYNLTDLELAKQNVQKKYDELLAEAKKYNQSTATLRKALNAELQKLDEEAQKAIDEKTKADNEKKAADFKVITDAYIAAQDELDAYLAGLDPALAAQQNFDKTIGLLENSLAQSIRIADIEKENVRKKYQAILKDAEKNGGDITAIKEQEANEISALNNEIVSKQEQFNKLEKDAKTKLSNDIVAINKEKNDKILADDKALTDKQKEDQQKKLEAFAQAVNVTAKAVTDFMNFLSESNKQKTEADLQANKAMFDEQTSSLDAQLQAQLISQEKYNQEKEKINADFKANERKIRQEQWKKDQQAAIIEATINTAVAITANLANPFLAALAGVAGALEIAAIAGQTMPAFAKGGAVLSGQRIGANHGVPITRSNGDNLLATVKTGEVILNEAQQNALGGAATFARIGVPGFASGGISVADGSISSKNVDAYNQQVQLQQFFKSMPAPRVIVQDIVEGVNNAVSVQQSADI